MVSPEPEKKKPGRHKVVGDAAFSVGERILSQVAQFAVFVVAARVLGPAEFGIFALVSACAFLLLKMAEVGWAPFIMSHSGDDRVPRQVLFIAILNGLVFGALGGLGAMVSGWFGMAPDIVALLTLFSLWVVLASASAAQHGVLIWMDRVVASALCEIIGELIGVVVAITALLYGAGFFALIYGRLAAQSVNLILSFAATRRMPIPEVPGPLLRELWSFSSQIFVSRMLVHVRVNLVTLVIGAFLGPATVGYYRAAERLVGAVSEVITVPGQLLAWTHLRRARDHGPAEGRADRIDAQVGRHLKVLLILGVPPFLWLIVMADELVGGLLGRDWLPAASLVAILAVGRMVLLPGVLTEPLMSIVGQARRLPWFMALIFVVSILLTASAVTFGVHALAWAQVATSIVVLIATVRLFRRHGGVHWGGVTRRLRSAVLPLIIGLATITLLDHLAADRDLPDLVEAICFALASTVIYSVAVVLADPAFRYQARALIRRPVMPR